MSYIGKKPTSSFGTATSQTFTGNNSTTAFTLNRRVTAPEDLEVFVSNIQQQPTESYTIGSTGLALNFDSAPPSGEFYVVYRNGVEASAIDVGAARTANTNTFSAAQTFSGGISGTTGSFSGAVTANSTLDMNGTELILDADGDTSITADTDDQIDFKVNNIDSFLVGQDYVEVKGVHPDLYIIDTDDGSNNQAGLFYNNGVLSISADHSNVANNSAMVFFTDGTERARFNTDGNLAFAANKGIDFANASAGTGGTGAAETSTATVLDDYEEGTFTPSSNSVTGGSPTAVGMYVKVGNMVNISVRFSASGCSTNGHQFGIYLPFKAGSTQSSGSYNTWFGKGMFTSGNSNAQHRVWGLEGNGNYVDIRQQNASNTSQITGNAQGGNFGMHFSITYRTKD